MFFVLRKKKTRSYKKGIESLRIICKYKWKNSIKFEKLYIVNLVLKKMKFIFIEV